MHLMLLSLLWVLNRWFICSCRLLLTSTLLFLQLYGQLLDQLCVPDCLAHLLLFFTFTLFIFVQTKWWCTCTLAHGGMCPPQIHLLPPPHSKASWPFWRDFWGPKMLLNPNLPPGPRCGSLQRFPRPLARAGLRHRPTRPWPRAPRF